MKLSIGIKSDPIESRYSFDWLFALMQRLDVPFLQLGSFPEIFTLEDGFFFDLRERAATRGVVVESCFTAHRDLGGFFSGNEYLERSARRNYERFIEVAAILGASSVGGNPGSVYRDKPESKAQGTACYLHHMKELAGLAHRKGLKRLALEPMSSLA